MQKRTDKTSNKSTGKIESQGSSPRTPARLNDKQVINPESLKLLVDAAKQIDKRHVPHFQGIPCTDCIMWRNIDDFLKRKGFSLKELLKVK